jgi:NADH-quinone oxidoreductase subunit E
MDATAPDVSAFALSPPSLARIQRVRERYPTRESALMPCLWVIQDELGYIPPAGVEWLAAELGVPVARVWELCSFYVMFRNEPQAEHVLQVCHNISCHIMGARGILAHLEKRLGIRVGERTPDGKFALEGVECLGSCGSGPCLQLGKHLYENLTPERVDELLEGLRRGAPPRPDTERELEERPR